MRRPLAMLLTVALTLALSLLGGVQSARAWVQLPPDQGSCINVSVAVNVVVTVDVSVNVTVGDDGSVNLGWQTGPEPDTAGWNVYRADADGPYVKMNGTLISNDSSGSFTDVPDNGQNHYYLLESMSSNGQRKPRAFVTMPES